ncbi:hypothetical protein GALL_212370 [mine drainage metagenome]|uniref:Uncharacterized protein n=1 Tax=mine drainage metagenome TaxID=410659 RepID=A0A1J5RXT1_9ZZZZ
MLAEQSMAPPKSAGPAFKPAARAGSGGPAILLPPELLMDEVRPQLIDVVRQLEESPGAR